MVDPLERHFLFALPWLAAFIAGAAAHVSVIRELPPPRAQPTAPLVEIDIDVDVQAVVQPATDAPRTATVITVDPACAHADEPALAPDLLFGIRQLGPGHFEIDRHVLDRVLDADLQRVRVVPALRDGRPSGVKLYGVHSCSPLGLLGLRNGDLLVRINGEPIDAQASTVAPFRRLHPADRVSVDVLRRGQPLSLVYEIR